MSLRRNRARPLTIRIVLSFILFIGLPGQHAFSQWDLTPDAYQFNGFATIGLVKSGTENLGYRRDVAKKGVFDDDVSLSPDSLLGLQFGARLTDQLDTAMQLIIKDRDENGVEESIEWLYLRYRFSPALTGRLGRIGIDLFMLSEYRYLQFSYLWARPPIEFYAPVAFDHFEGADIAYNTPVGMGTLNTKLFVGSSKAPLEFVENAKQFELNDIIGITTNWESERWQFRFTASTSTLNENIEQSLGAPLLQDSLSDAAALGWTDAEAIADDLALNNATVTYYSAGIAYDHSPWLVQTEVTYVDSHYTPLKSYIGQYLSIGYHMGPTTLYSLFAKGNQTEARSHAPTPPAALAPLLTPLQEAIQFLYDYNYIEQHSTSLGLRWDLRYDIALKFQWDRTWVETAAGSLWEQKHGPSQRSTIDTYSLSLNSIF